MGIKEDYGTRALRLHNDLRAQHGADPLVWSLELYQAATNYAIRMANRAQGDRLEPNKNVSWGQNLFEFKSRGIKRSEVDIVEKAINLWYSEGSSELPTREKTRRNFSQIIWQDTRRLGVGVATNLEGTLTVVIAYYDPPGNFQGEYWDNIAPSIVSSTRTRASMSPSPSPSPRASPARSLTPGHARQRQQSGSESNCSVHGDHREYSRWSEPRESPPRASPARSSPARSSPARQTNPSSITSLGDRSTVLTPTFVPPRAHVNKHFVTKAGFTNPSPSASAGLKLMNQVRAKHGAPSLKLDQQLCAEAQQDAEAIAKNLDRPNRKEGSRDLGRSLCTLSGAANPTEAVEKAVSSWAEQKDGYDFSDPVSSAPRSSVWSQLVWKGSKEVGIGVAKDGETYGVAALFTPPGNAGTNSEYLKNVSPTVY